MAYQNKGNTSKSLNCKLTCKQTVAKIKNLQVKILPNILILAGLDL